MMGLKQELRDELKDAMRAKDQPRLAVLRAIETEMSTLKSSPGFSDEVNDELYLKVVTSYAKKMTKALKEYEKAGERGEEQANTLRFEVDYLSRWLPKAMDEAQTRELIKKTIDSLGVSGPQAIGRVMGAIMKDHKDEVDGGLVSRLVKEALQ